jgi:hypothetical protein
MENQTTYYNAKPSNITNIGADVSGAKRHNFDTYESTAEKEARKQSNRNDKEYKEALKQAILAETPDKALILKLVTDKFIADYGFDASASDCHANVMNVRRAIMNDADRKAFNALVTAFNKTRKVIHAMTSTHDYYFRRFIESSRKRYEPKDSFTEESGARFDWKQFEAASNIEAHIKRLGETTSAVQFGNSVSDKERGYICQELVKFIKHWHSNPLTQCTVISDISWSFGARGKAGSVAYYQHNGKVISVNRNRIGSIIHEVGHFLDFNYGMPSDKISRATINAYAATLPEHMIGIERRYYCSRVEIFARAFEAYCFHKEIGFSQFAQCGKMYLPELNDELIGLIESVLK